MRHTYHMLIICVIRIYAIQLNAQQSVGISVVFLHIVRYRSQNNQYDLVLQTNMKATNTLRRTVQLSSEATSETLSETREESKSDQDMEAQNPTHKKTSHLKIVFDQTLITPEVLEYSYTGSGTSSDPYLVEYLPNDDRNPLLFREWVKWAITSIIAMVGSISRTLFALF